MSVGARRAGAGMLLLWALVLAACSQEKSPAQASLPDTLKWYGVYSSDTLPSVGGALALVAHLAVGPDSQARMALEFPNRGTILRGGIWWAVGQELTFEPRTIEGTPFDKAFVWRLEGQRLVPVSFDRDLYGAGGIPMTRRPPIAAPPPDTGAGVMP